VCALVVGALKTFFAATGLDEEKVKAEAKEIQDPSQKGKSKTQESKGKVKAEGAAKEIKDEHRMSISMGLFSMLLWGFKLFTLVSFWRYLQELHADDRRSCNCCRTLLHLLLAAVLAGVLASMTLGIFVFSSSSYALLFAPALSGMILSLMMYCHRANARENKLQYERVDEKNDEDHDILHRFTGRRWGFC